MIRYSIRIGRSGPVIRYPPAKQPSYETCRAEWRAYIAGIHAGACADPRSILAHNGSETWWRGYLEGLRLFVEWRGEAISEPEAGSEPQTRDPC